MTEKCKNWDSVCIQSESGLFMDDIVPFHGVEQNVKAPDHADADGFLSAAVEGPGFKQ